MFTNKIQNIQFQTSIELSAPFKIGLEGHMCSYPHNSSTGHETIGIIIVFFSKQAMDIMQIDDKGLLGYTKSTYLGTSKPAVANINITVNGKNVNCETIKKSIPEKSTVKAFVLALKSGDKAIIAFDYKEAFDETQAEKIFSEITSSLTEV